MTAGGDSSVPNKMKRAVRADMGSLRGADAQVREILEGADVVIREAVRHYRRVLRRVAWIDAEDLVVHAQYAAIEAKLSYDPARGASILSWTKRIVRARLNDVANSILDPTQAVYKAHLAGAPAEHVAELQGRVREVALPSYGICAGRAGDHADGSAEAARGRPATSGLVSEEAIQDHAAASPEDQALDAVHTRRVLEAATRVLTQREQEVITAELDAARAGTVVQPSGRTKQAHSAARQRAFARLRAELSASRG